jgi:hypothetical protein
MHVLMSAGPLAPLSYRVPYHIRPKYFCGITRGATCFIRQYAADFIVSSPVYLYFCQHLCSV